MTSIVIVGGIYREICIAPQWNQLFGSGGRAAAALSGHVSSIELHSFATSEGAKKFQAYADSFGIDFKHSPHTQEISFEYLHCLAIPFIYPRERAINDNSKIIVNDDVVLRFGMMEGSAEVHANRCVYDPQSSFSPEIFNANGSSTKHLAVVANKDEIILLSGNTDPIIGAKSILKNWPADVVIIKSGIHGAYVVEQGKVIHVPAYVTDFAWTIGSGDIFAATFTLFWGVQGKSAEDAANLASKATAFYVESMSVPIPTESDLRKLTYPPAKFNQQKVYIAGPFFDLGQRWVIEEVRRVLIDIGLTVFSPFHEVGDGPANIIAPADIKGLKECDVVFALLDGTDSGTLFEVGYACSINMPVYALAQRTSEEDLKMVEGSGCKVFNDLSTSIHHLAWKA